MRFKRWQKGVILVVIWVALMVGIYFLFNFLFSSLAITPYVLAFIGSIPATVVTLMITKIFDKIIDFFFGKEEPLDVVKLGEIIVEGTHEKALKDKRRGELKGYLKTHYENDILPVMKEWFRPLEKVDLKISETSYDYEVLSVGIYYQPYNRSRIKELTEPRYFQQNIVAEAVEHLSKGYPEDWQKWINLKDKVNPHLRSALRTLEEIEENVKRITENLGLVEWNLRGAKPADYCHFDILVKVIWIDPEHHQHSKRHIWDDYEIHPENGAWQFGGTWAFSQRRETLEELKMYLNVESSRITDFKAKLSEEKSKLDSDGKVFQRFLENIEDDYLRRNKWIRSSCSTCKEWLDELERLGA